MRFFEVGGCVRDELLGVPTKDIDFAVEADSFEAMKGELENRGFTIFLETPEFLTIRARFPKGDILFDRMTADFVLCRKDSPGSDGRRPDFVEVGTIFDDLARRDFTVNAMAKELGFTQLLDPHKGQSDLANRTLRFVGNPADRINEDFLRVLRAFRFVITKGFTLAPETEDAIMDPAIAPRLAAVSVERRREELRKAFMHDTLGSLELLMRFPEVTRDAIFEDGLRLAPTLKL
jgi:tRNA nucleotidyltransferase/poly(A) polymerase